MLNRRMKKSVLAMGMGLLMGIQGMTVPRTASVVYAQDATQITEDIFNGAADEWMNVPFNELNPDANLIQLKAVSDGTYLYGYASAKKLSTTFEVYFAADGTGGMDMSNIWSDATNVCYKMDESGCLYRYDGAGWSDIGEKGLVYQEERAVEFRLSLADLTDMTGVCGVAIMESETSTMPAKKKEMLKVDLNEVFTDVAISLEDSAMSEWSAVSNVVKNNPDDTMYNIKATRSQERLYALVTSRYSDFTTDVVFYLDTDVNGGYTMDGHLGVDYMVKDARLHKVDADNTLGDEICSVDLDYYADSIELQIYLEDLGNPESICLAFAGKGYEGSTYDDTTVPNKEMTVPMDGSYFEVTASFEILRENGLYYPKESFDSFTNPYIGWAGWANQYGSIETVYDYDLAYVGIKWRELEPEKGKYDFDTIREIYHIDELIADGKRINLRFIMDNPDSEATGKCMDIPRWLYEELVAENGEEGAGTYYYREDMPGGIAGSIGSGFSPNYDSELLLAYHEKAIEALAKEFDDPSVVGFVQVGSIGHWAEFHTWPSGTGMFPTPAGATKYMEPYTKYFKNVKLGIRKPYPYAAANGFGLFNDIFGVSEYANTESFLEYIEDGCTDMGEGATLQDVRESKMPDFWKTNYSGGEFASGNVRLHLTDPGTIGCLQQVRDSHTSWLGPCSVTSFTTDMNDAYDYKVNVEAMQKLMGYRFYLRSVTKQEEASAGAEISLSMKWDNKGVAPMYYNWPMEVSLIDEKGEVAYSELLDVGITEWLPGLNEGTYAFTLPKRLSGGNYTLAVAIADPQTEKPAVKLAMVGGREDLRYPLYQMTVSGSANPIWFLVVLVVAAIIVVLGVFHKKKKTK